MDITTLKRDLAAARNNEQIHAILKRELDNLGAGEWIYLCQVIEFFRAPIGFCMNTLRPDWLMHYLSNCYFAVDPLFKHFRATLEPLFWSVEQDWRAYGPGTVAFQADMKEWGYWGGVCIPIQTFDSAHGFLNLVTTSHDEQVVELAARTAFLMRYVQPHILRVWVEDNRDKTSRCVRFTGRETEIMMAVADGQTTREIAQRLHLAPRTVDAHITSVQEKLKADNRTQALCKAVNLGLLQPEYTKDVTQLTWIAGGPDIGTGPIEFVAVQLSPKKQ